MNSLILCEGATDAILLSYYLKKVSGWTYTAKAPDGLNIRSTRGNESVNWYKRGNDYLLICGVGGKDNFIGFFHQSLENPIIGLEPEALTLLQEYSWPYNYTQFRRILNELTLVTDTTYVSAKHVKMLLEKEQEIAGPAADPTAPAEEGLYRTLNLDKPLNDITMDIIHMILEQYGGNQSAAAKHLKIGRSTLWRYLK